MFKKRDELVVKYKRIESLRKSVHEQMIASFSTFDWKNDEELIQEIILHLPECFLRFRMFDALHILRHTKEKNAAESGKPALPQDGGDGDA